MERANGDRPLLIVTLFSLVGVTAQTCAHSHENTRINVWAISRPHAEDPLRHASMPGEMHFGGGRTGFIRHAGDRGHHVVGVAP